MKYMRCFSFFAHGIRLTNKDLLQSIRFNLLLFAIAFFFSYISAVVAIKLTYSRYMQEAIVLLLSFPFITYTAAGTMYYYTSWSKGVTVRLNQMYRAYRYFTYYLVYALFLVGIYLIFWKRLPLIFDVAIENSIPLAAASLFFIYCIIRLFFLPVVFVDTRLSFEESIIEALRISRNKELEVILFIFISICLCIGGLLAFGAGILYSTAVIILAYIKFYLVVRDEYHST